MKKTISFCYLTVSLFGLVCVITSKMVQSVSLSPIDKEKGFHLDPIHPIASISDECKSDDDCSDPNSICESMGDDNGEDLWMRKCICNEFYHIYTNSDPPRCTRLTCTTNKDCSSHGYCGATGVCWPKCISDLECIAGDTCNIRTGTCFRKCSNDDDCFHSRANVCDLPTGTCQKECDPMDGDVCELPELCDSSGCHPRCMEESDCTSTQYCDAVTNFCLQIKCLDDSYCGGDQYCSTEAGICKAHGDLLE